MNQNLMYNVDSKLVYDFLDMTIENRTGETFTEQFTLSKSVMNSVYYASEILNIEYNLATELIMELGTQVLFNVIPDSQKKAHLTK